MGKPRHPKRPRRARDDLVVINPAMFSSSRTVDANVHLSPTKQRKQASQATNRRNHKTNKQPVDRDASVGTKGTVGSGDNVVRNDVEQGSLSSILRVKCKADVVAGAYWILLARTSRRPCVVALSKQETSDPSPAHVAAMLRHVGFQAVVVHAKMPVQQRKDTVQRWKAAEAPATVLVTTARFVPSTASAHAHAILVHDVHAAVSQVARTKFAHVYVVTSSLGRDKTMRTDFLLELTTPCLQQLHARLKLARQIVDLAHQMETTKATGHQDDKWIRKFTKGADLLDDTGEEPEHRQKKRKRAQTPEEQRLEALTEKLYVMLARKLPGSRLNGTSVSSGDREAANEHRREKLDVLGLVTLSAAVGLAMTNDRTSAQTRWMDCAEGSNYGGEWQGAVRHGASKDNASLALRAKFCADKAKRSSYLCQWRPNNEPLDTEKWGGAFGKACGHNEVVMHALRPFYPQEVLNSKVCSHSFPAPGNQGFDGCLEHLRFACMAARTSMTLWDAENFIFISAHGHVTLSKKNQLLSLSLASLQCLVPALRSWTVANGGHVPVTTNVVALQLCCALGCGDIRAQLPLKTIKRIMTFVLGGSARLWRQIAKIRTPLDEETVY
ncbi:hypothetical protein PsorP6_017150 [Peronosclerospora sorghi]|uniref:Uncharacterized protein n=1 Tax=Peronosclerospora sorghi TaxID=230839 RepID=A0ACC0WFV2_9STRA|nr:hypothetical protein PsorP6_017150 [Peronosclerospora sorghi]